MPRVGILHPEFTWHTAPTVKELRKRLSSAPDAPHLRAVAPLWVQRLVGFIHQRLKPISRFYCWIYDIQCPGQIWPLPFGLLMKHSDGTRIEEVITTRALYDAGLPVPKVISYGAHQHTLAPVSILMTRLPGEELFRELWEWFNPEEKQTTIVFVKEILCFLHSWKRHRSAQSALICSINGSPIRSVRVPFKSMPPCLDVADFNSRLIEPADPTIPDFENRMARVKALHSKTYEVVFTHGDLTPHNILVMPDGRVAGLIDWEAAGYYPEYWEYTTAWRVTSYGWWFDLVHELADGKYDEEREADADRWTLTNGTMLW